MSSDDLKKIKRIADIGADVHTALFEHIEENEAQHSQIIEKVDGLETDLVDTQQAVVSLQEELKTIELTPGEKGEQGIQGKQGIKGEKGDKGDRGERGEDGYNGIDGENGKDGLNGQDGKDGSPDTGEQIVKKINKQKTQIDASKIKNLPQPVINQIFEGKGGVVGLETIKQDGVIKSQSTKSLNFVGATVTKDSDNVTVTMSAGVTDHGDLTGLTDDDHTQYLRTDGTRTMTGNLDVDGHYISFQNGYGIFASSGLNNVNLLFYGDRLEADRDFRGQDFVNRRSATYTYTNGLLTQVVKTSGRTIDYTYTDGVLTSYTDGVNTWTLTYDSGIVTAKTVT